MKKIFVLAVIFMWVLLNNPVNASTKTDHYLQYFLNETNATTVIHSVNIDHQDKYNGLSTISFIEPTDNIFNLKKTSSYTNYNIELNQNKINVEFDNLIIGPVTTKVSYEYKTNEIFKKRGTTYTLDLPLVNDENINTFELKVYTDLAPNIENAKFITKEDAFGKYFLFNKESLKDFGGTVIFGTSMYYDLQVNHIITNEKNYIVIPPTIKNRQQVVVKDISQLPSQITTDKDNNLLFIYNNINDQKIINAKYTIKVYGNNSPNDTNINNLTSAIKNWDYTKGIPKALVSDLQSKKPSIVDINQQVISVLNYDSTKANYNTINRIGAENINNSNKDKAVCLEYSDLLIAVLRGLNIPAKEINGITYTQDITNFTTPKLHSWVDYLNQSENTWSQVDPTWSDTSNQNYVTNFDYYHIAFLQRGQNSEQPILTGSYSNNGLNEELKLSAYNNPPSKQTVTIKKYDILGISIVKNDSLTKINTLNPKKITLTTNFSKDFTETDLYTIEVKPLLIKDLVQIKVSYILMIISVVGLSIIVFIFLNIYLKNKTKKHKHKVSSIT